MHTADAITLLLFSGGAFLIPLLVGRIGIPAAVGEILYGVLIGKHVLGLVHENSFITVLAELGFCFLMFLVGLELDFSRIEREGPRGLFSSFVVAALIFAFGLGASTLLGMSPFMMLVFGAMSVGIMLATLNDAGQTKSNAGQTMIFVGSVGEFLTIILLTALHFYYKYEGLGWPLFREMAKLALIFGIAYVVLVLLRTAIWWRPKAFSRVAATHDPAEIGVRSGMALMLVFVSLASMLGIEAILGAFIAGALFSFAFRHKGILETKLASIGFGFFVPVFFIWVGTEFDPTAIGDPQILLMVAKLLGASLVVKLLPSLLLMLRGLSFRESVGSALLLASPLTLLVAIARIGLDEKLLDDVTASAVVLLAIVGGVLLPGLFRLLVKANKADPAH
jgi:Kef-type K+ transport system membrane component KefB